MSSARDLTVRLADLLRREHVALGEFLLALADFDRRRCWLELGHSGLFPFLHRELGLSKGAAYYRKVAAELVQRYPEVIEPVRDGRLCITSVVELAKVITPENRGEVLPRFFHRSKGEAKAISAALQPATAAPRRDVVTAVRRPAPDRVGTTDDAAPLEPGIDARSANPDAEKPLHLESTVIAVHPDEPGDPDQSVHPDEPPRANPLPSAAPLAGRPSEPARTTAEPVTADLRRLHVTVSRRFLEKLDAARSALSHARPGAGAEEILEAGLDLLLERTARRRGLVGKPRPGGRGMDARATASAERTERGQAPGAGGASREDEPMLGDVPAHGDFLSGEGLDRAVDGRRSREGSYVPAHVRRAVWTRDGSRCRWPLESGGICGSTLRLQLDHVIPRARGGPSTVENLRVVCAVHNAHAARLAFGEAFMERFTHGPGVAEGASDGA